MSDSVVLVTGAGGEMGHLLLPELRKQGHRVVALDIKPLSPELAASSARAAAKPPSRALSRAESSSGSWSASSSVGI